ncbi:tetraspanin-33 isoform X1 [Kryptolebias marmoratus]|uniref:tetraspanin-33 isoform X1 n=1 Tax=Kryptolebias marmoratus TaxID=37003 RepID=UPI0007F8DA04|nr:tetraspanin-33 isoform X1 [Kryptolebias marmoratus]
MRGYRGIKYTLFIFCYFFWVVSAVLIAVGIYAKIAKEKDVVDTLAVDPALLLIVVGVLMFLITFLGCFGALRNATCLLKTFLAILVAIFLLQIAAGVVGYIFTDTVRIQKQDHITTSTKQKTRCDNAVVQVMDRTEKLMMKAIVRYREDQDLENAIDFIQKKFQCCGVEDYKDWSHNVYFECSDTNPSLEACGVPFSCCILLKNQTVLNTMCGYGTQQMEEHSAREDIFTIGCVEKIIWWAKNNLRLVGGLMAGLLLLEVCMMSLAGAQISWIKKVQQRQKDNEARGKSEQKERLWFPAFTDFTDE